MPHDKLTLDQRAALRRNREAVGARITTYIKEGAAQARAAAKEEADRLAVLAGLNSDSSELSEEDEFDEFVTKRFLEGRMPTTPPGPSDTSRPQEGD